MCSLKEWKVFFICGNIFILILGSILSFTSATDINNFENFEEVIKNNEIFYATTMGSKVCIGVGVLMVISAGIGITAVIMKAHLTLFMYSILIFMVGLLFFVCGCFSVSCTDRQLEHKIRFVLKVAFNKRANNTRLRESFERMEMKYYCCGVNGLKDYRLGYYVFNVPEMVPYSCCEHYDPNKDYSNSTVCPENQAWDEGCASVIIRLYVTLFLNMGCIAIPAGTLMLIFGITTLWYNHMPI